VVRCCVSGIVWFRDLRELERKYLESFGMSCWRRMEKIKWSEELTDEVLECLGDNNLLY
jgi:hypothetical protein